MNKRTILMTSIFAMMSIISTNQFAFAEDEVLGSLIVPTDVKASDLSLSGVGTEGTFFRMKDQKDYSIKNLNCDFVVTDKIGSRFDDGPEAIILPAGEYKISGASSGKDYLFDAEVLSQYYSIFIINNKTIFGNDRNIKKVKCKKGIVDSNELAPDLESINAKFMGRLIISK